MIYVLRHNCAINDVSQITDNSCYSFHFPDISYMITCLMAKNFIKNTNNLSRMIVSFLIKGMNFLSVTLYKILVQRTELLYFVKLTGGNLLPIVTQDNIFSALYWSVKVNRQRLKFVMQRPELKIPTLAKWFISPLVRVIIKICKKHLLLKTNSNINICNETGMSCNNSCKPVWKLLSVFKSEKYLKKKTLNNSGMKIIQLV